jgi:uncharacterized protein (DUF2237 family)
MGNPKSSMSHLQQAVSGSASTKKPDMQFQSLVSCFNASRWDCCDKAGAAVAMVMKAGFSPAELTTWKSALS